MDDKTFLSFEPNLTVGADSKKGMFRRVKPVDAGGECVEITFNFDMEAIEMSENERIAAVIAAVLAMDTESNDKGK